MLPIGGRQKFVVKCDDRVLYDGFIINETEIVRFDIPGECCVGGRIELEIELPDTEQESTGEMRYTPISFRSFVVK